MNVSPLKAEPRSAEAVHSYGELVTPGPVHSWARHYERDVLLAYITLDVRGLAPPASDQGWHGEGSLQFIVLLLVSIIRN